MALSPNQKLLLSAIGIGVVVGLVVGGLGAYLNLSAGIRGGITGAITVIALQYLRKQMPRDGSD